MNENTASEPYLNIDAVCQELRIRREVYIKIVTSFANSLSGKMKSLNDALAVDDRDMMRMVLHEIKGTAGNLRLRDLAAMENIMHVAVKAGESTTVLNRHFESLRQEVERMQKFVGSIS